MKQNKTVVKSEFDIMVEKFLKDTNTVFACKYVKHDKYFSDDKEPRDIYVLSLTRGSRSFDFLFGQSVLASGRWIINDRQRVQTMIEMNKARLKGQETRKNKEYAEPRPYDLLACITKSDPSDFENFCSEYGYDSDSIKALSTYHKVVEEWRKVQALFNDSEIELLQEVA